MNPTREQLARVRTGDVVTAYYECGATMTAPVQSDGSGGTRMVFGGALTNFEVLGSDGLLSPGILGVLVGPEGSERVMYGRRPTEREIELANGIGGACPPLGAF